MSIEKIQRSSLVVWTDWHIITLSNKCISSTFTSYFINRFNIPMYLKSSNQSRYTVRRSAMKETSSKLRDKKFDWKLRVEKWVTISDFCYGKAKSQIKNKKYFFIKNTSKAKLETVIWVTCIALAVSQALWSNCMSRHAWGHHSPSLMWKSLLLGNLAYRAE